MRVLAHPWLRMNHQTGLGRGYVEITEGKKHTLTLKLWLSTVGNFIPRRHLAISGDILVATF